MTEQISKWLFKLTVFFQFTFFASLGWSLYTVFHLQTKHQIDDPRVSLELDFLEGVFFFSVASLAVLYFRRLVRWRNLRKNQMEARPACVVE